VDLPPDILSKLSGNEEEQERVSLLEILKNDIEIVVDSQSGTADEEYESNDVRSIIGFPMLLLHTLRIFQLKCDKNTQGEDSAEVKSKHLLSIFERYDDLFQTQNDVESFIKLLWKVRERFDRFVVKWVSSDDPTSDDEQLEIKRLYRSEKSIQRRSPDEIDGLVMLQSMLYHSQQINTLYWLTPFLNQLLRIESQDDAFEYLLRLDNALFTRPKQTDLRVASFKLMSRGPQLPKAAPDYIEESLMAQLGTRFPRYWFYKLEFVLWLEQFTWRKRGQWKNYRITSKNSIEHISPRNKREHDSNHNYVWQDSDTKEEKRRKQDDFGNLVLISPGMNSEYSNKSYRVKREEFLAKRNPDSLKSDLIFSGEEWNWNRCVQHRNLMIEVLKEHANKF
jgi:hypothetical protein